MYYSWVVAQGLMIAGELDGGLTRTGWWHSPVSLMSAMRHSLWRSKKWIARSGAEFLTLA